MAGRETQHPPQESDHGVFGDYQISPLRVNRVGYVGDDTLLQAIIQFGDYLGKIINGFDHEVGTGVGQTRRCLLAQPRGFLQASPIARPRDRRSCRFW